MANKVTNQLANLNFLAGLTRNQRTLSKIQQQMVSGRVVNSPEDDPNAIGTILLMDSEIKRIDQHKRNTSLGKDFMDVSEAALGQLSVDLQRARELVVRVANGTLASADRLAVREELFQLLDDAVTVGNQQFAERYLFSGTRTKLKPFVLNTATLTATYGGNSRDIVAQLDTGSTIAVNIVGDDGSNTGLFQTAFKAFKSVIDAIDTNSPSTISSTALGLFDDALDKVGSSRTLLGARSKRMAINEQRLDLVSISAKRFRSELQDLDIAEGVTRLTTAETTFRASLAVGARVLQPSLLDFLR